MLLWEAWGPGAKLEGQLRTGLFVRTKPAAFLSGTVPPSLAGG